MTQQEITDLLERAAAGLHPSADLVEDGVAAGRRRRRRHAAAGAIAALVLGLTGTGLGLALHGDGSGPGRRGLDPAGSAAPIPTPTASATVSAELAVDAANAVRLFASINPGEIGIVPGQRPDDERPIVDFLWNGYAARVGVTPGGAETGEADAQRRCETYGFDDKPCDAGRLPGSYEESVTVTGRPLDGGVTVRFLHVYLPNGWDVLVTVANAADTKNSPLLAAEPPLTADQLRDVAYSPLFFR